LWHRFYVENDELIGVCAPAVYDFIRPIHLVGGNDDDYDSDDSNAVVNSKPIDIEVFECK